MTIFSSESWELAITFCGVLMGDAFEPNFIRMLPSRTIPACLRVTSSILKDESKTFLCQFLKFKNILGPSLFPEPEINCCEPHVIVHVSGKFTSVNVKLT